MFIKTIYNNLFNLSSYSKSIKKSLLSAVVYVFIIIFFFGSLYGGVAFIKQKPIMEKSIDEIYSNIPDFELSNDGFKIDSEKPIIFDFAGKSFHIDGNKTLTELVITEEIEGEQEVIFIGNDGYGFVTGTTLKSGNFFSDVKILKDVSLVKDDFRIIYETIKMINKDIFFLMVAGIIAIGAVCIFMRGFLYSVIMKVLIGFSDKNITFKDLYKASLYGQTFYIAYLGVALFSNMNINVILRLTIVELISIFYIVLISFSLKKKGVKGVNESVKNKKRP